jgi:hypothetical protein
MMFEFAATIRRARLFQRMAKYALLALGFIALTRIGIARIAIEGCLDRAFISWQCFGLWGR